MRESYPTLLAPFGGGAAVQSPASDLREPQGKAAPADRYMIRPSRLNGTVRVSPP